MEMKISSKNVDAYLKTFTGQQRETLDKVRAAIKTAAPKAEEVISYGIPAYKQNGMIAYFAGFKNHCSYFPGSYAVIKQFEKELKSYKVSKGTIQFPIDKPLSSSLIKKMVQAKIKENELKQQAKSKKKTAKTTHEYKNQNQWQQIFL
jgi:uncharacterized protein YdhG (YjbR/CyaY superfamily)